MTEMWPPTGYTDPKPYNINDRLILAIALVLTLLVIVLARPVLADGASEFSSMNVELREITGLAESPILYQQTVLDTVVGRARCRSTNQNTTRVNTNATEESCIRTA